MLKEYFGGLFVASIIVTLFAASALATEPSGDWTADWETSYMNLENEDHHANFTPVQVYYNYGSWSMTLGFRQRSAYLRTVTDTRLLKLRIQTALYGRETFLP